LSMTPTPICVAGPGKRRGKEGLSSCKSVRKGEQFAAGRQREERGGGRQPEGKKVKTMEPRRQASTGREKKKEKCFCEKLGTFGQGPWAERRKELVSPLAREQMALIEEKKKKNDVF